MAGGGQRRLPPLRLPWRGAYHLLGVRVPHCIAEVSAENDHEGCVLLDLTVAADGVIDELAPAGGLRLRHNLVQGQGRQLWPVFADIHAHLDKTATWDRAPNRDGTFDGAIDASREARKLPWSVADVFARMNAAVEEAYATGTAAIRTHIDSTPQRADASWSAFSQLKSKWRGRVELQGVVLFDSVAMMSRDGERLADVAAQHGAALGPVIYPSDDLDAKVLRSFELAERRHVGLDFHVDETGGAIAHGLDRIAELALSRKFKGSIICGHACSLSLHDDAKALATIQKLAAAKIGVVSLPATNLYLQARRPGVTPAWRGVTRLHELRAGGVAVAVAGDNRQDAFYPFGDYDMLDVFRDAVRIAHLDMPMAGWIDAVSANPARLMGLTDVGRMAVGMRADVVAFPYRSTAEVLARRGAGRQILRNGRPV
jgi:cytosine/creatinine deaminase